jgi:hypothetical protein
MRSVWVSGDARKETDQDRREEIFMKPASTYLESVNALPQPKAKALRYLKMRLAALGHAGELLSMTAVHTTNFFDPAYFDAVARMNALRGKYAEALGFLAVTEKIALGTNTIHDSGTAELLGAVGDSIPGLLRGNETYAAQEAIVRKELATLK